MQFLYMLFYLLHLLRGIEIFMTDGMHVDGKIFLFVHKHMLAANL